MNRDGLMTASPAGRRAGSQAVKPGSGRLWVPVALSVGALAAVAAWLDARYGWITPAFDAVAHLFYEVPLVARDPSAVPACARALAPRDRVDLARASGSCSRRG